MNVKNYSFVLLSCVLAITFVLIEPSSLLASTKKPQLKKRKPLQASITRAYRPRVQVLHKDPYRGAIVIDADTGETLFEDKPDLKGYPASMIKMMNLLVVLDAVKAGSISLKDKITVSAEVSRIGGSQVYLKEKEVFTVDDLLYALMVQSANDAALALALHTAGTKDAFVALMNKRASEIGMKDTTFHSVHGLPPGRKQFPDVSTPRDISLLARELLNYPDALRYASTKVKAFRENAPEPFIMRNHNHLVKDFEGCDGLKTGFFYAAGFSIAATAVNDKGRAIAVVMGSSYSKVRDNKAREFLSAGLMEIAAKPPPPVPVEVSTLPQWSSYPSGNRYLIVLGLAFGFYGFRNFRVKN